MIELNFDGLVGPTHHYGGLGVGNLASQSHAGRVSHPRAAALQGLDKIRAVARLADPNRVQCAVLPPQVRPALHWLRQIGFQGRVGEILAATSTASPALLSAAWSASAMWTANAATVTPSCDAEDGRLHLTVSNLSSSMHRSLEPNTTLRILRQIFHNQDHFQVHAPLPGGFAFRDEGAANHMRLCGVDGRGGHHLFVHGESRSPAKRHFARQGRQASEAIIRQHAIQQNRSSLISQHPSAIDAGAFHNDVVATSCDHLLLYHEYAFEDPDDSLQNLQACFQNEHATNPLLIRLDAAVVALEAAVSSYLFNSQILPTQNGYALLCPIQCQEMTVIREAIDQLLRDPSNPLTCVEHVELRESMHNGGGPACLRLRFMMTHEELAAIPQTVRWTEALDEQLRQVISQCYRESLTLEDLLDADFADEAKGVVAQLHSILGLHLE